MDQFHCILLTKWAFQDWISSEFDLIFESLLFKAYFFFYNFSFGIKFRFPLIIRAEVYKHMIVLEGIDSSWYCNMCFVKRDVCEGLPFINLPEI